MTFKDPLVLLLIPVLAVCAYLFKRRYRPSAIRFSSKRLVDGCPTGPRLAAGRVLPYLRFFAAAFFVLALARPQELLKEAKVYREGIGIVLALDASGSMLAEDFRVNGKRRNRLDVVKTVVEEFIHSRVSDKIGIVAFAARAYTVCPLTLDYDWLIENLERVEIGAIEDGTAVGSAIASSLNRLKDVDAKSKVIVLLTDGMNNTGDISPIEAAAAAKALGVKIYTIGAGTKGLVPYPARDLWGRKVYQKVKIDLDEEALKAIARKTGGLYFRATDTDSLKGIYKQIDSLEKARIEDKGFREYKELFPVFLIPGLFLLMVEVVFSHTIFRKIP